MKPLVITEKITTRETDSFKQYLKDISNIEPFKTPEDELICARKAVNGDKKAMDELVKRNLRFVVSVAKQYKNEYNSLEDLVNEGNLGLIKAAQKFDPDKGFKLISYAVNWIRKALTEFVVKNNKLIKIPLNKVGDISRCRKQIEALEQKLGRPIDINELLNERNNKFSKEDIEILEDLNLTKVWSLDKVIGEDDLTLYDTLRDNTFPDTDYLLNQNICKDQISELLNTLKPKEADIINKLYGLNGHYSRTLTEIGDDYNCSREFIRQTVVKTLTKLKKKVKQYNLTF
jgi:RNA polymerase primary sigma factor